MQTISEQKVDCSDVASGWFLRITGLTRILGRILFFALLHSPLEAAQSVTLAWDQSTDPIVAGYNIHYGGASQTYTNEVSVGLMTNAVISGLVDGATYYFAATAYTSLGVESPFSNEVSYTAPLLPGVQLRVRPSRQFILTVTGPIGHTYGIEATQDFKTWTIIGTVLVGVDGSLDFTDPNTVGFPKRFYRIHDLQP